MRLLPLVLLAATANAAAQDLQIRFAFPETAHAEVDSALLAGPNVVQAYELDIDGDGWTERLLLSFQPREATPEHANLNNFVATTHEAFLEQLPDRTIRAIGVDLTDDPLTEAGLPFAAFGFFRPAPEGAPVCDSAALFFESAAGFWTLSWNAPRGWLRGELRAAFDLIGTMEIEQSAPTIAAFPDDLAPPLPESHRLAVIR